MASPVTHHGYGNVKSKTVENIIFQMNIADYLLSTPLLIAMQLEYSVKL